ncbi:hypothetical protein LTR78_001835 [Recurvomyces mirabilis]|uniref:Uncharacterized protein n=1 Tax=Recurvomyces mirabilis TaxID=574656 RepID=A0AAE0WUT7_9PEZI|nr:hypothetical protein LTR78_001835 [Recurvomyces mirabilis]
MSHISQSGILHRQAPVWSWIAWWISLALDWRNERSFLGWFFSGIVLTGLIVSVTGIPGLLLGRLAGVFGGGRGGGEEALGDGRFVAVDKNPGEVADQDDIAEQEDRDQMSESRYQRWLGLRRQIRAEETQRKLKFDEEGRRLLLACSKTSVSKFRLRRAVLPSDQAILTAVVAETISEADTTAIDTQAQPEKFSTAPDHPVNPLETAYNALVLVYARLDMILAYARRLETTGESFEAVIAAIFGRDEVMDWARSAAMTLQQIAVLSSVDGTPGTPDWSKLPNIYQAHMNGFLSLIWRQSGSHSSNASRSLS